MSDSTIIAMLGSATTLLAAILSFVFGRRYERQQQALTIRAQMLKPIEDWLGYADRMINILGDTLTSAMAGLPQPVTYNFEDRRKATQFMGENSNSVLGILASKSLQVGRAKNLTKKMSDTIITLDGFIKYQLLPLDNEILTRGHAENISPDFLQRIGSTKLQGDTLIQSAYSLIAQIKTALT